VAAAAAAAAAASEQPGPSEDLAAVDAGIDAPIDAPPKKKKRRPDAGEETPLVAEGGDSGVADATGDGGTQVAMTESSSGPALKDPDLVAAGSGSGMPAATETGSGSGTPGMDNQ